jgi:hypothetical protein
MLHCAGNLNTFLLLEGRKRWVLIDPSHLLLVYPYLSRTNNFQLSLVQGETDGEGLPLFRYCPRTAVDLQAGDCLLVPSWWYHCVRNLDARTLAIAVRWSPFLRGEVCTNSLFRFLHEAVCRVEPGVQGIHRGILEYVVKQEGGSSWGLTR